MDLLGYVSVIFSTKAGVEPTTNANFDRALVTIFFIFGKVSFIIAAGGGNKSVQLARIPVNQLNSHYSIAAIANFNPQCAAIALLP